MSLWKERPVAQSDRDEHPAVSTQFQALKKTSDNFTGTFDPVTLSLLSLLYLHAPMLKKHGKVTKRSALPL